MNPNPTAAWQRPAGVARGTWQYVQSRPIATGYDDFVGQTPLCDFDADRLRRWLPGVPAVGGQSVADLGCGTGRTAIALAKRGYDVVAVDLSEAMLAVLGDKLTCADVTGTVRSVHANLVDLGPIPDRSVDHAVCLFATLGMIHGRVHRRGALQNAARIVRPGGSLVVHVHHRWAALREPGGIGRLLASRVSSWIRQNHEFGDATYPYRGLASMFMHRFSAAELRSDARATGWRIKQFVRIAADGSREAKRTEIAGGFIVRCENVRYENENALVPSP